MIFFSKIIRGRSWAPVRGMYSQVKLNDVIHAVSIPDTVESTQSFRGVFFETLHFSIYLVLPMIFRTLDFWKSRIFRTNSASFQKFALDFSNLKIRQPRKTGPSHMYYWISLQKVSGNRKVFSCFPYNFYDKKRDISII